MVGKRGGKRGRRKPARKENGHGNDSEQNNGVKSKRQHAPDPNQNCGSQNSRQASSSHFSPPADTSDPPGNYTDVDVDHDSKNRWEHVQSQRESVDADEGKQSTRYSYSSDESDQNDYDQHHRGNNEPRDWQEEEEEQYHQLQAQTQDVHHQQNNHDQHEYNHESDQNDNHDQQHGGGGNNDPRDWQEDEEDKYHQLQTQTQIMHHKQSDHQQEPNPNQAQDVHHQLSDLLSDYEQQHYQQNNQDHQHEYNHDDHAFTQFNIQPIQQPSKHQHHGNAKRQEEADVHDDDFYSDDGEDEEAPLFFAPSNNFNFATDNHKDQHAKGDGWGVDYLMSRADRKERDRQEKFEIEGRMQERRERQESKWWWESGESGYEEDEWDDIDFNDYHSSSSFKCKRFAKNVLISSLAVAAALTFHALGKRSTQHTNDANLEHSAHKGSKPSSRWGHRFDDDDALGGDDTIQIVDGSEGDIGIPKYHKHSHNTRHGNLTVEEKEMEAEKWEDFGEWL